jgi:predicted DNA-binding protein
MCYNRVIKNEGASMTKKTTTIRFNEDEQKIVDLYMEFQDQPFSTIVKEALMDDIADFFDSTTSEEAIEYNKNNSKRYTSQELLKELGIE